MTDIVKLYGLVSSRDNIVRYIGQTKTSVKQRFNCHYRGAIRGRDNTHKAQWIRKEIELGFKISPITILENCLLDYDEKDLIRLCVDRNHDLTNFVHTPKANERSPERMTKAKKSITFFSPEEVYQRVVSTREGWGKTAEYFGYSKGTTKKKFADHRRKLELEALDRFKEYREKNDYS